VKECASVCVAASTKCDDMDVVILPKHQYRYALDQQQRDVRHLFVSLYGTGLPVFFTVLQLGSEGIGESS
jgi:hypothetical protein